MKGRKVSKETLEKMKNVCKGEKNYRWIKDRTKLKQIDVNLTTLNINNGQ